MKSRKERIIQSAKILFAKKGFAATGLREIADKAGVSLGNIYNHFKNKESIFDEIFDARLITDLLAETFVEVVDEFPFNIDKAILSIKRIVDSNIEIYQLAFIDLIEFGGKYTNRMMEYIINFGKSFFVEKLLEESEGGRLKDLNYDFLSGYFMFSIINFFSLSHILPALRIDNISDKEIAEMIADVVLNGIKR
jgi:AcrR family transcriptional regulator